MSFGKACVRIWLSFLPDSSEKIDLNRLLILIHCYPVIGTVKRSETSIVNQGPELAFLDDLSKYEQESELRVVQGPPRRNRNIYQQILG